MDYDELHSALSAHADAIRAISADLRKRQTSIAESDNTATWDAEERVWTSLEHARLSLSQAAGWIHDAMAHVPEVTR